MAPLPAFLFLLGAAIVLIPRPGAGSTDFIIFSDPPTALLAGQSFHYDVTHLGVPYGPYTLDMQHDCNLVLYNYGKKIWATNTSGLGSDCYLTVDSHGEAILESNLHYPVWKSGSPSEVEGEYAFLLQWNGGIGVYGPAIWWSSNQAELSDPKPSNNLTTDYAFYSYSILPVGNTIAEYRNLKLVLRDDCNLVLLDSNTERILWQTNTYSPLHDCFVTLDAFGELFVKHNRRDILWSSGVKATTPYLYMLVLRYDAKLVIYGPQIWTTAPYW